MVIGKPGRKSQSGRKPPQADHAPLALFLAKVPGYITCSPVATPKTRTAPSHDRAYRGIPHGFAAHRHARFQPAWDRAAQSGEAQEVKAKEGQASMTRRNRSRLLSTAILTTRSISLSMTRTVTASGTCRFTTWISMSPLISSVTTLTDELLRHVTKITRWRSESLRGGQALAVFSGTVAGCSGSAYIESIGSSRSITSSYSPNPLKRFAKTRP
jgi:hypothetical protein